MHSERGKTATARGAAFRTADRQRTTPPVRQPFPEVENVGVAPDIEVELGPAPWRAGRDPQLEKTIEWLLAELQRNPPKDYKRPPYPDYHKNTGLGEQNLIP